MSSNQQINNNMPEFEDSKRGNHAKLWQFPLKFDTFAGVIAKLAPSIPFNVNDIEDMMNPLESLEDVIRAKIEAGKTLKTADKIRLENIERKKKEAVDTDMALLKKSCLKVHTKTPEGKELQLLMILDYALEKNMNDIVANCYIKLLDKKLSKQNKKKFSQTLSKMNTLVQDLDIIKLQFTKFSNQLPPLDRKEFILDPWQKQVINYIDDKESVIVMCPTSSGKTVMSTYVTSCNGKILFVVPTEALAMQVGAHFTKVLNSVIAIETDNTHTINDIEENEKLLHVSPVIVGTPMALETVLTKVGNVFSYVVFDEIHNLDLEQGEAIERICKMTKGIPFLALSATIGNLEELVAWWQRFTEKPIKEVSYNGRFFNLQKCVYLAEGDDINAVNPLSMVEEHDFEDKSILNKNLQMTPTDIYNLVEKIMDIIDLGDLDPNEYFDETKRLSLDDCNNYFRDVLQFMVELYHSGEKGQDTIRKILNEFHPKDLEQGDLNIMDMMLKIRDCSLLPVICFQMNNISCFKIAMDLLGKLEDAEDQKYPNRKKDMEKRLKQWKKWNEKNEKKTAEMSEKQFTKHVASGQEENEFVEKPEMLSPHQDFIISKSQAFTESTMLEFRRLLKWDFKGAGDDLHPIIRALYRGIGIYIQGMPHAYLRLVQQLAQQKKLGVVFSDSQLAFGVSMPFKTSCLFKDIHSPDTLTALLNHQASGRAGRRGLDTEGYVIYAGYSWPEVVDLCISPLPRIEGKNYCYPLVSLHKKICNDIHGDSPSKPDMEEAILCPLNSNLEGHTSIYFDWAEKQLTKKDGWTWCYKPLEGLDELEQKKALAHNLMVWSMSRIYPLNSIVIPYLLRYLEKKFYGVNFTITKEQVRFAHVMSHFICQKKSDDPDNKLKILPDWQQHIKHLNKFRIGLLEDDIDSKVYASIEANGIIPTTNDLEKHDLRQRIWHFGENIRILQNHCFYTKNPLYKFLESYLLGFGGFISRVI